MPGAGAQAQGRHETLTIGTVPYAWAGNVTEAPLCTLGSERIPTAADTWGGANFAGFSDTRMDADMRKTYSERWPVLPLFFRSEPHVAPTWLQGYAPTGQGDLSTSWAENWHPG